MRSHSKHGRAGEQGAQRRVTVEVRQQGGDAHIKELRESGEIALPKGRRHTTCAISATRCSTTLYALCTLGDSPSFAENEGE